MRATPAQREVRGMSDHTYEQAYADWQAELREAARRPRRFREPEPWRRHRNPHLVEAPFGRLRTSRRRAQENAP
ncbi:hypothetical protein GCM10009593_36270 [Microlunatus antarcticus]